MCSWKTDLYIFAPILTTGFSNLPLSVDELSGIDDDMRRGPELNPPQETWILNVVFLDVLLGSDTPSIGVSLVMTKKMVIVKWEELLDTQVVTPLVFLLLFSLEPFGVSSTSGKFLNFKRTIGTEKRRRNWAQVAEAHGQVFRQHILDE